LRVWGTTLPPLRSGRSFAPFRKNAWGEEVWFPNPFFLRVSEGSLFALAARKNLRRAFRHALFVDENFGSWFDVDRFWFGGRGWLPGMARSDPSGEDFRDVAG
jgi:hypothetical protein